MTPSDSTPTLATSAEFARIAGFKPSYVRQLKLDGRLVLADDGKKIDVQASLARIAASRDPSKAAVAARHAEARSASRDEEPEEPAEIPPSDPNAPRYQEARARREHYQALAAQRDFEVSMGNLLDAKEVEAVIADAVTSFRTRLETLQDALAPQLAAEPDEVRCRALLADQHEQALRELARSLRPKSTAEVG